jgi:DNA-binding NarL/FixJ family response regulator
VDTAARAALAALVRGEVRTELAAELEVLEELRLRVNVLEAMAGVPTGLPRGARARQREVVRLRAQGLSLRRIATTLAISRATVESDLARAAVVASPEGIAADGKRLGARRRNGRGRRAPA